MSIKYNIKKYLKLFFIILLVSLLLIVILIFVPLALDRWVFQNNEYSALLNGEWASFLGSYLGGIVGAIIAGAVTLIGINITIKNSKLEADKDRKDNYEQNLLNVIENVKPYIQIVNFQVGMVSEKSFILQNKNAIEESSSERLIAFKLKNVGKDTATNIMCEKLLKTNNLIIDNIKRVNIFYMNNVLGKNDCTSEIYFIIDYCENGPNEYLIDLNFNDLFGNEYSQLLKIICIDTQFTAMSFNCISDTPILVKRFDLKYNNNLKIKEEHD